MIQRTALSILTMYPFLKSLSPMQIRSRNYCSSHGVFTCNLGSQEAEAGGSHVLGQLLGSHVKKQKERTICVIPVIQVRLSVGVDPH